MPQALLDSNGNQILDSNGNPILGVGVSTFTPPSETYPQTVIGRHRLNRLMAHYAPLSRGRNVFYLSNGSVTETDPDGSSVFWADQGDGSVFVSQAWYSAPETAYTVSATQAAALVAAGYEVS